MSKMHEIIIESIEKFAIILLILVSVFWIAHADAQVISEHNSQHKMLENMIRSNCGDMVTPVLTMDTRYRVIEGGALGPEFLIDCPSIIESYSFEPPRHRENGALLLLSEIDRFLIKTERVGNSLTLWAKTIDTNGLVSEWAEIKITEE